MPLTVKYRQLAEDITTLEKLPETVTEFDEAMWSSLVDYVTVNGKDDLTFALACGVEIAI